MSRKPKLHAGDTFPVELAPGDTLEARILLDVDTQCILPRRLPSGSPLRFFAESFLVEVRRDGEPLVPGVFVHADSWTITGRHAVAAERIDFPQTATLVGPRPHFSWGEVMLPLALSVQELRALRTPPAISPASTLVPLCLYRLGRKNEIDSARFQAPDLFDPARIDLRFSPHAERIRALLGDRIDDSYFVTAMRYGYDPRRFYDGGEKTLLLCPYCNASIEPGTIDCPTCGLDVRDDAPVEISNVDLALARRTKCRACEGPMLETAVLCPGCKTRQ